MTAGSGWPEARSEKVRFEPWLAAGSAAVARSAVVAWTAAAAESASVSDSVAAVAESAAAEPVWEPGVGDSAMAFLYLREFFYVVHRVVRPGGGTVGAVGEGALGAGGRGVGIGGTIGVGGGGKRAGNGNGSGMARGEDARDVTSCRGDYLGERVVCGENRDASDDRARMLEDEPDGNGVGAGQGVVGDVVVGLERAVEDAGGGDDDTSVGGSDADASGRDSCVGVTSGGHVLERALVGNGAGVGSGAGDRPGERAHA